MEIKILCACGAKFKFDVEPVNGQMPWAVKCPVCGADGTAQANAILQALAGTTLVGLAPPTEIAPPPPGVALAPPPAPLPASPGRLRLGQPPVAPPPPEPAVEPEGAPEEFAPPPPRPRMASPRLGGNVGNKQAGKLVGILTAIVVAVVAGLGAWKYGGKWFHRLLVVDEISKALGEANAEVKNSDEWKSNFDYSEEVVIYIQHKDHKAVADACQEFWKEKLHKTLTLSVVPADEGVEEGEYELQPSHHGWVRLVGPAEWPAPQYEALALHLSQKFNTLVFESSDVDVAETAYRFGVYEAGARKFYAKIEIKTVNDELDVKVTTEGNEWAFAHGFKPGEKGFQEFGMEDADKITQKCGMKFWDEKFNENKKSLLLTEGGRKARAPE
ncbi:MAG: hypothetical protein EXS35_13990 [Pedosphaera sp.]|nr:hypothetical protein [Pedosphaera sp.]